jgi:hypothetical protein
LTVIMRNAPKEEYSMMDDVVESLRIVSDNSAAFTAE